MINDKRKFFMGLGMLIGFVVVLVLFFSPIFGGQNGLDYLDNLYNSISKGSAYYIPKVKGESSEFHGRSVSVTLAMANRKQADQTAQLFVASGAESIAEKTQLKVTGDLGKILDRCLADADAMYYNDGQKVSGAYGYNEKTVLYNWWKALKEMEKALKKQKKFQEAQIVALVKKKAVETSYNYYTIEPKKIADRIGIVIFSLVFYVIYTMWYGFGFMFIFEGLGMKLGH